MHRNRDVVAVDQAGAPASGCGLLEAEQAQLEAAVVIIGVEDLLIRIEEETIIGWGRRRRSVVT